MTITFDTKRKGLAAAAAAVLCIAPVLTACGGSSDAEGGGSDGKDTLKVFSYGPYDAKGFSLPSLKTGAQAGVDAVNAAGGINGKKLELITCNDDNDPNTAAGCARMAVEEKVIAVLGGFSTFEPQVVPVLEKAGIPIIGTTPITNFTSPVLYPVTGGTVASFFGLGKVLVENPVCTSVGGLIEAFAATEGAVKLLEQGVQGSGGKWGGVSKAPQGARDFAPAASAAGDKSPCVGIVSGPQTTPVVVEAAKQNPKIKVIATTDSVLGPAAVKKLGATADGIVSASNYLPLNDSTDAPEMKTFLAAGRKIDPNFDADQGAASGYLAAGLLKEALKGVTGDITTTKVKDGLDKISGYDTGLGPIVDFATKNPSKAFARLPVKTPVYEWVAKDGLYTLASDTKFDMSAIYQGAADAGR